MTMARALDALRSDEQQRSWAERLPAAKRRFREIFPGGFRDPTYLEWERDYKWAAHVAWQRTLDRRTWARLLAIGAHRDIAARIAGWYAKSKLNMLALYEWMALREALADATGARLLSAGLYDLIHGASLFERRLEAFTLMLDRVPQRQTRLAKWPVATLFPFVARPATHLILKPMVTKRAAERLGFELAYASRPNAHTYAAMISYVSWLRHALLAWRPRDLIDLQGFLWVTCSEEYEDWPWE
jgi:hypothetical protein